VTLPRATTIQFRLYEVQIYQYSCGKTIYHATNSDTMTFAEGSEPKYFSYAIAHRSFELEKEKSHANP
jgi:hypothetical protein